MIETRPIDEGQTQMAAQVLGLPESNRCALPPHLLHDLRTPINQIVGYAELLMESAQDDGHGALVPDLARVRSAGEQLLSLINGNFTTVPSSEASGEQIASNGRTDFDNGMVLHDEVGTSEECNPKSAGGSILVVDDNAANRDVFIRRLLRQGHRVATAEDGLQALEMMQSGSYELVLLDIMMPNMDGFEVLRRLKADERYQHIPIIIISAMSEVESAVRCIEMGAEDYLPKPFDPTLLKARTIASLERKRAHDREDKYTRELQESYRRAKELERMRDDLTNMIVHDLRTPISSLISGLYTMQNMGELNVMQREVLGISLSGGQTLLDMINDLLDINKMESGALPLDLKTVKPAELIRLALRQVNQLGVAASIKMTTEIEPDLPSITADGDLLLRAIVNLLGNAIRFTPVGGAIKVSACRGNEGKSVVLAVSDTGEGIPPESCDPIFQKFGRVETGDSGNKHSTGLGLTFCKMVVEAHGGSIRVESKVGFGSTFSCAIPTA